MGGPNLEVFKFGMYIMFPIGFMYYFGINLDSRFSVPDFWPKRGETHEIPYEREDIAKELERLKARRLAARARRLAVEQQEGAEGGVRERLREEREKRPEILEATRLNEPEKSQIARQSGWGGWFGGSKS